MRGYPRTSIFVVKRNMYRFFKKPTPLNLSRAEPNHSLPILSSPPLISSLIHSPLSLSLSPLSLSPPHPTLSLSQSNQSLSGVRGQRRRPQRREAAATTLCGGGRGGGVGRAVAVAATFPMPDPAVRRAAAGDGRYQLICNSILSTVAVDPVCQRVCVCVCVDVLIMLMFLSS